MCCVVNIRDLPDDWRFRHEYVYIGRQNKTYNLDESPFHNPYHEGVDGSRSEVIQKYREYIYKQASLVVLARNMLKGKTLVCWCKPLDCHGDVLVEMINEISSKR
jgi:hypothetical protein